MEWFLDFVSLHLPHAHWVLFGALILAGCNLPIPEDIVLIAAGVLASSVTKLVGLKLFLFTFAGAYLSDWMVYAIGRYFGPNLWKFAWFRKTFNERRYKKVETYYTRYGILTLLIGRFIPFGARNCLFTAAGMVKMPFLKFIAADAIACFSSNVTIFGLAYLFGKNYEALVGYLEVADLLIFGAFVVAVISLVWYKRARRAES